MTVASSPRPTPPRMLPLATLPVFFRLEGKRAVVAGGTDAAAWKAELLAAAGADVDAYAEALDPVFADLVEATPIGGPITHHERRWDNGIFRGASIAVCDARDEAEAEAFARTARRNGVPVNVIDSPTWCDFQFGSIVNRSPAIVAISTGGAAPILGQAIRRRIETLLPPSLSDWTRLAGTLRSTVAERLSPGGQRRAFWEHLVDRAFGPEPGPDEAETLLAQARSIVASGAGTAGRVTLVGAGPGDAELLAIKAVRALQAADVILFDDLVSAEVLELARREARRMLVAERGRGASCPQEDSTDMMVKLANAGKHVVRLRGGDPMVSGCADEEMARLQAEGIAVSVVPGIAAARSTAASLGVPLTHRDFGFVNGYSRSFSEDAWRAAE